ncbi:MAG: DUF1684 domain-containing protein [Candidatus Promineifilaceae bacterium]|nr:DUF1684 domain-containing protein [Candidatus Promineifilaceae bacterium]
MQGKEFLYLAEWRREVAALYAQVRKTRHPEHAWHVFRKTRDKLFSEHPQSPLEPRQKSGFAALNYFHYDENFRIIGTIVESKPVSHLIDLPAEGVLNLTRFAKVKFDICQQSLSLSLYWVGGYGGGIFLPFRDKSNAHQTYGGGRYLYDGIKGADLGAGKEYILLDFNFAYNPSCAYNERWVCPLAPPENWLDVSIEAGEKDFVSST